MEIFINEELIVVGYQFGSTLFSPATVIWKVHFILKPRKKIG